MIAEDTGTRTKKMFVPTKSPLKKFVLKNLAQTYLIKKLNFSGIKC